MKTANVIAKYPKSSNASVGLRFALLCGGLLGSGYVGCQHSNQLETGGETHFLKSCSPQDNDCGDSLSCVCGVCTINCDDDAACRMFPKATCVTPEAAERCGEPQPIRHCDAECRSDEDCAAVSPFHVCMDGACRTESPTPITPPLETSTADAAMGQPSEAAPEAGTSDATDTASTSSCVRSEFNPNDLLLIGDSFFAASHLVTGYLEGLARDAGILAEGERYRDGSRMVANMLASGGIREQYLTALDDGVVRVVIMNGSGADAFISTCEAPYEACTELLDAIPAAEMLLAEMAQNGVTDVVYAFYPDSTNDAVRGRVDFLRPSIEAVCASAPLDCHWLDLRETFQGFMDSYIAADGSLPTAEGSEASANAIWGVMRENCIAQ